MTLTEAYIQKFYMLDETLIKKTVERFSDSIKANRFLEWLCIQRKKTQIIMSDDFDELIRIFDSKKI